ncbi:MAG TPA: alpha/beta hydrolase [Acidimicrobiales bacterium]|nr:alpha/beta hydrolase [Acidimicrobiales bacterium]
MGFVTVNGFDLHYLDEGQGQPVVFIHGFGGCAEGWYQQFEALTPHYRVIAYDSVNHGHSVNTPAGEPEPDRADELEGFLAALGIDRPVLAGNSMGALTLLRWATRHPGDAVALVPSGMGITPPDADLAAEAERGRAITAAVPDDVLFLPSEAAFTREFREARAEQYERYVRLRSTATRIEASHRPRRATMRNPSRDELGAAVASITAPMQIVIGDRDWLFAAARHLHELVPASRLHVIDGAPHNAYFERADDYNRVVLDFLAAMTAEPAARR